MLLLQGFGVTGVADMGVTGATVVVGSLGLWGRRGCGVAGVVGVMGLWGRWSCGDIGVTDKFRFRFSF